MHRVLGRINLAFHVVSVVIALILPSLTRFAGMPIFAQERTRWPYAWTCGIGYLIMLAYIWTIAPIYW